MTEAEANAILDGTHPSVQPISGTLAIDSAEPPPVSEGNAIGVPSELPLSRQAVRNQAFGPRLNPPGVLGVAGQISLDRPNLSSGDRAFVDAESARLGAPVDVETGVPAMTRAWLGFHRAQNDQVKYLQSKYGQDKVELSNDGRDLMVQVQDSKTQKPKWITVNEHKMTVNDFAELVGQAPEAIGGLLGSFGAKGAGFNRFGQVIAGALGMEAAGALKDASVRGIEGTPINPSEIADVRGKMSATDAAMGTVGLGVGKVLENLGLIKSPLQWTRTEVQKGGLAAQQRIMDKTKVFLPLTGGESTGAPLLQMMENYVESQPAGTSALIKRKLETEGRIKAFQQHMIGPDSFPTFEETGKRAIGKLQGAVGAAETAVETTSEQTAMSASTRLLNQIKSSTKPTAQLYDTETGKVVREKVLSLKAARKGEVDAAYGKVYELPEANEAIIPTKPISAEAKLISKELPDKTKVVSKVDYDTYGNPIERTETGSKVPIPEYVPDGVQQFLKANAELDEKMPLQKLIAMRGIVNDAKTDGEALKGVSTRYLGRISHAITTAIDDGISKLPDGELKKRLVAANSEYKTKLLPFEEAGVADLFKNVDQPGFVENSKVVDRLFSDKDKYLRTMSLIGKDSDEAKVLHRAFFDRILNNSQASGSGQVIDGKSFIQQLESLRKNNRELYDGLIGKSADNLVNQGTLMSVAQGSLSVEDARKVLTGKVGAIELDGMVRAQNKLAKLYQNKMIKAAGNGTLKPSEINPDEFVDKFLEKGGPGISEIREVLDYINTDADLATSVRSKTIQRIFNKAQSNLQVSDLMRNVDSDPTQMVTGRGLMAAMGNSEQRAKIKTIIGPASYDLLLDYIQWEAPRDLKKQIAKDTGTFTKGSAIGHFLNSIPGVETATRFAKYKILGNILGNETFAGWLSQSYTAKEIPALAQAIVTSEPFIRQAAQEFGRDEDTFQFLNAVRKGFGIDKTPRRSGAVIAPPAQAETPEQKRARVEQFLSQ